MVDHSAGHLLGGSVAVTFKITLRSGHGVAVESIAQNWFQHIDFLKCQPSYEGKECQCLFGVVGGSPPSPGNPAGIAPPQTICLFDLREERLVDSWFAGTNNILDDFILVPKQTTPEKDFDKERNAWILAPFLMNGQTNTTSFVILDAANLACGAVAEAHIDSHHIPWGLHGTWWSL